MIKQVLHIATRIVKKGLEKSVKASAKKRINETLQEFKAKMKVGRSNSRLLAYMHVNVGNGKNEKIPLHEGDEPDQIAQKLCDKYGTISFYSCRNCQRRKEDDFCNHQGKA